jgi:hypothetical protein
LRATLSEKRSPLSITCVEPITTTERFLEAAGKVASTNGAAGDGA